MRGFCHIERSDLPVGRTMAITGDSDDDAMRRAIAIHGVYWPGGWRDAIEDGNAARGGAARYGRARPDVQPCAIVEFGRTWIDVVRARRSWPEGYDRRVTRAGAYLHILDHEHGLDSSILAGIGERLDAAAQAHGVK